MAPVVSRHERSRHVFGPGGSLAFLGSLPRLSLPAPQPLVITILVDTPLQLPYTRPRHLSEDTTMTRLLNVSTARGHRHMLSTSEGGLHENTAHLCSCDRLDR